MFEELGERRAVADQPPSFPAPLLTTLGDRSNACVFDEPCSDAVDVPEAACGGSVEFENGHVAVSVADETGDAVPFAVEQAETGRLFVEQSASQRERVFEASRGPLIVQAERLFDTASSERH